ncbi:MAG TPA: proteasome accessory factor PafA2 family protein [Opitutaceae bacterium]|nr:proteasome accessory factor PafA2 family protein [Opitutaceae bacterium]
MLDGSEVDGVELLARFRQRAAEEFAGRDQETDAILALWRRVEAGLASDVDQLIGVVDWVTKRHLLETFRRSEDLAWNDPWLEAQDLEYHHIDPARSLGLALTDLAGSWAGGLEDSAALAQPPSGTRATVRSNPMRQLAATGQPYKVDWHFVQSEGREPVVLLDPFATRITPGWRNLGPRK